MDSSPSSLPLRRIVRLVGSGGMGAVYEAWDLRLERRVALKVLHPHLTAESGNKDRLLREARLAARLEHPGIVRVYGIHDHEGGLALEMQFVEGTPLHRLLLVRALSAVQAADLLRQVLEALAACHAQGVIHCDLKPGNLLVTPEGKVLLTDFGISRALYTDGAAAVLSSSLSGPLWGTPQYCPPEAWEGALPTPSWDLYALGVLVHEALAKSLPFQAQTPAVLMREKLDRPHVSIRSERTDLSVELAGLIDSLKASQPEHRPAGADAALELLHSAPELRHESAATQSFRHTPVSTGDTPSGAALHLAGFASPAMDATPPRRSWKLHAFWISLLAISVIATYAVQRFTGDVPTPMEPATIAPIGEVGEILDFIVDVDTAFFSYDDGDRGRELWFVPPSGHVELVKDINPGPGSSNPRRLLQRPSGGVLFAATTPDHGEEPWFSGRPPHTVRLLRNIGPGQVSSGPIPLGAWDSTFLFYATTLQDGTEPWLTSTREGQTGMLRDLCPGDVGAAMPPRFLADDSGAYLIGPGPRTWNLWRYNQADASIREVADITDRTGEMIELDDILFLVFDDTEHGQELWMHRPDEYGIRLFADLWEGPESSYPQQFFVWKDALYFQAMSEAHGKELWKSDGSPGGTALLLDIAPGQKDSGPYGFVATNDLLFFRAVDVRHGQELWVTDGTAGGTRYVFDVWPGTESSNPYNISVIGELLFFSADDGAHGEELWVLDPAQIDIPPRMVEDLWPGPQGSEPHDLNATGANSGIFVRKTPEGDALVQIAIEGEDIRMTACTGLARSL